MSSTALPTAALRPTDKILVGLALVLGLVAILGAWGSQIIGHLVPCELCLGQRLAYYWGLPVLAAILLLWNRLPLAVWYIAMAVGAAIFVWSTYMGVFHAGVEWGFWPGPTACTGPAGALSFGDLQTGNVEAVIPCDQVQWRDPLLKLSLAGYNALLSAVIVVLLGAAMLVQARRPRG
ncbi:MAG: disulfide bond formation protein B [Devosia sp.]